MRNYMRFLRQEKYKYFIIVVHKKKKIGSVYIFLDNFLEAVMLTNCLHTQTGFRC